MVLYTDTRLVLMRMDNPRQPARLDARPPRRRVRRLHDDHVSAVVAAFGQQPASGGAGAGLDGGDDLFHSSLVLCIGWLL